jgi:hypothetical protein
MKKQRRMAGCCAGERPWSKREEEILREAWASGGKRAAMAALPGRTLKAIYDKTKRAGIRKPRWRLWSKEDEQRLRGMWGYETSTSIARALDRVPSGVYAKAMEIGLRSDVPEGYERLSACARRMGYNLQSLRIILRWAGIKTRPHVFKRRPGARTPSGRCGRFHQRIVDSEEAEAAVVRWSKTEPIRVIARRLSTEYHKILRLLGAAGVKALRTSDGSRAHWRVDTETCERVVAAWRARMAERETARSGAARYGVCAQTMSFWLKRHGVKLADGGALPSEIDEVAALHGRTMAQKEVA